MLRDFPRFVYTWSQRSTGRETGGVWWLVMAPGIGLIGAALALLIWPELLAYVVASVLLCVGIALVGSGWRLWQLERHLRRGGRGLRPRDADDSDDWVR